MSAARPLRAVGRALTRPLRARFDAIDRRLDDVVALVGPASAAARAAALARVDVSGHNAGGVAPRFGHVVSQVVSAAQFADPDFERLRRLVAPEAPTGRLHRKDWEFAYVLRAAEQHGRLAPGLRAVGFGVGREPVPAALAHVGLSVLATDLDAGEREAATWAGTGQHMTGLDALSRPDIVDDAELRRLVRTQSVDMKAVPDDLGRFDLVWSCCALEHLGSPAAGLDFVLRSLDLLAPGGVAVHTTELELSIRAGTADYGRLAVYRKDDLDDLAARIRGLGFEIETNWYVSLDTPADRWIALPPYPDDDPAHLRLVIGDSISTSVGLLVRRPG